MAVNCTNPGSATPSVTTTVWTVSKSQFFALVPFNFIRFMTLGILSVGDGARPSFAVSKVCTDNDRFNLFDYSIRVVRLRFPLLCSFRMIMCRPPCLLWTMPSRVTPNYRTSIPWP